MKLTSVHVKTSLYTRKYHMTRNNSGVTGM